LFAIFPSQQPASQRLRTGCWLVQIAQPADRIGLLNATSLRRTGRTFVWGQKDHVKNKQAINI